MIDESDALPQDEEGDDSSPLPDQYQQYIKLLSAIPALDEHEQRQLADDMGYFGPLEQFIRDGAHDRLWQDSARLVLHVMRSMHRAGKLPLRLNDMDAIQHANLAVGEALMTWEPSKGRLSTFLVPRIRGALLNYVAQETRHGLAVSMDEACASEELSEAQDVPGAEQESCIPLEETLAYEDEVFPDPADFTERAAMFDRVQSLPPVERDMLEAYVYRLETADIIADRHGKSVATVYNTIAGALSRLRICRLKK